MDKTEFTIVPKLLGIVVNAQTGEVAGIIDASGLLTQTSKEALTESLGKVVIKLQFESEREKLERMYLLPSRDIERERE